MRVVTGMAGSLLAVVLCGQGASLEQEQRVRDLLQKGNAYKAMRRCDHLLNKYPGSALYLALRADALNMIGEHEPALRDAERALATSPNDPEAWLQCGIALQALARFDSAEIALRNAMVGTWAVEARYHMAGVMMSTDRSDQARMELDQLIAADPGSARAYRERGASHAALGDSAAARIDLDKAIELAPRDPVMWNSRGAHRYAHFGQHERAILDFDRAIKLNPNYSYAFNNRGWSKHKLGHTEQGLKDIRLAQRKKAHNPYVYRNLGLIALDQGDVAKACIELRRALEEGFTAQFGSEVEDLIAKHCKDIAPSGAPSNLPETPAPTREPTRSNAP